MPESAHDANVITDCYYVDGIPPLLRESSASDGLRFVVSVVCKSLPLSRLAHFRFQAVGARCL